MKKNCFLVCENPLVYFSPAYNLKKNKNKAQHGLFDYF